MAHTTPDRSAKKQSILNFPLDSRLTLRKFAPFGMYCRIRPGEEYKKTAKPFFPVWWSIAFSPYGKKHNSALLSYHLFDYASIPFEQVDRGVRALLVLLLRILEYGDLNLAENAEVKLTSQVILAVLV